MSSSASFTNEFGSVYSDRVAFNDKKGWFGGGSEEELPIRHVTSVKMETTRRPILGVILVLVGFTCFSAGSAGTILGGIVAMLLGVLMIIGWPTVTINTAGNDLRRATGGAWQKAEAQAFVAAVRKSLFDKT